MSFVLWIHHAFINLGECKCINNVSMAYERKESLTFIVDANMNPIIFL